jgi:D-alanyl-D-alanine carboxypeptidase (penicillin-binding protein 5/6)
MKKLLLCFIAALIMLPGLGAEGFALSRSDIQAETAILMDADSGQILFDKNMDRRAFPASITKIMTGILALENAYPAEVITVSETAVDIDEPESSNIALIPGEELPLGEAMYALMMPSANDAANVIAEHVSGSLEAFASMMNEKAKALGAVNTHFANAHGLHEDDHYTTARDMALITRYAIAEPLFMQFFGAEAHTMPTTNMQPLERVFPNYQYMQVQTSRFYSPEVIGSKVGYTTPAKHTMVTVARLDGRTLICVVMGTGRNQKFTDTKALLDFGFNEFTAVTLPGSSFEGVTVPIREDGETVGEAGFSEAAGFSFLLHNSLSTSAVRFEADAPESFESDGAASLTLTLTAKSSEEAVPALLMERRLDGEVSIAEKTVPASMTAGSVAVEQPTKGFQLHPAVWITGAVIVAAASFVAIRRYRVYKRRKARLRRLGRKLKYAPAIISPPENRTLTAQESRKLSVKKHINSGRHAGS